MRFCILLLIGLTSWSATASAADELAPKLLQESQRILFLGDSITASGLYVAQFEAWIASQRWERSPVVINCGLPSETVSGLSEEGHAGGKFPRPDLAERLDRVLKIAKPDLVFACYGINCGIYQPFAEERFAKYQVGMKHLKAKVEEAGAKLILVTPPFFDDQRSAKGFSYNEVLDRYSAWLIEQRQAGWLVVDLHGPMTDEVRQRRQADAKFTLQPDGVHPNPAGHWFIARQLMRVFGDAESAGFATPQEWVTARKLPAELLPLVQQRMSVLRDAHVATAGHKRPGVAAGLPLVEAEAKAAELSAKIRPLLGQ